MGILDDVVRKLGENGKFNCDTVSPAGFNIPDVGKVTLEDQGQEHPGFDVITVVQSDNKEYRFEYKEFPNQFKQINAYIDKNCPGLIEKPPYAGACVNGVYPHVHNVQIVMTPDNFDQSYILVDGPAAQRFENCLNTRQMPLSPSFSFDSSCFKDVSELEKNAWVEILLTRTCDFRSHIAQSLARIQTNMSSPILHSTDLLSEITHIQGLIEEMRLYIASHKQPEVEQMLTKFADEAETFLGHEKTKLAKAFSGNGLSDTRRIDYSYDRQKMQEQQRDLVELLNLLGVTGYTIDLIVKDGEGTITVKKEKNVSPVLPSDL